MLYVEIAAKVGEKPLRIAATRVAVFNDQGTPLLVAGEYGPEGASAVASYQDRDFTRVLEALGFGRHQVEVDVVDSPPPPPGARLLAGG